MSSDGGNVQVSDAVFELDDLKGSGGITVTFSVPLSISGCRTDIAPLKKKNALLSSSEPANSSMLNGPVAEPGDQG